MTEAGWTRAKPTVAGWYWYRASHADNHPTIIEVEGDGSGIEPLIVRWDCADDELVINMGGEWSSTPIAMPREVDE